MSDTPKFEVIDRRKFKADEEEHEASPAAKPEPPSAGPQLVETAPEPAAGPELELEDISVEMPPPPTAEETSEQKAAYDVSAQRLEDLVRAQNPGAGPQQPVSFDQLVQQFYVSAMIQMGAGTPEGQRPRVDILGARQTIDLLGILAEKTRGNLNEAEDRTLQTVLYETRMAFLEVTRMITLQGVQAPPSPPKGKK
jgi:Domain of unknown function (DUF1844)